MNPCLGIEIGGTKLQLAVGSGRGDIVELRQLDAADSADGIRAQIESVVRELTAANELDVVGVGFGGPIEREKGVIECSHQVSGWSDFPLKTWLSEITGRPVVVENDANVSALAEALVGAGNGEDPVAYVNMGSGVGGGLVVEGRLYHGAAPGECEIGHLRLSREPGDTVESRCSGWAVDAKIRDRMNDFPDSRLTQLISGTTGGEAKYLKTAFEAGDTCAKEILEETAADLAFGLSHVVQLFHPRVIVLGGGLSLVGEPLREAVARHLKPLVMEVFSPGPEIRLAALGERVVPVGALLLAGQSRA